MSIQKVTPEGMATRMRYLAARKHELRIYLEDLSDHLRGLHPDAEMRSDDHWRDLERTFKRERGVPA